ncbi:hypothetical protein N665_2041s0005 [Sinapis alba]|nr:hypothetical protein N665_2041s0005 [Sinapis alba]
MMRKTQSEEVMIESFEEETHPQGDEVKDASPSQQQEEDMHRRAKKARPTKVEPQYLEEKRNLEDLWKAAFPVGTEWEVLDKLYNFNWDFKHLEEALEEGGILYGKKVFVFVNTEPQWISYKGGASKVSVSQQFLLDRQIDRMKFEIFILACTQRRSALKHLKEERFKKFNYCLPYFYDPFKEDELKNSTEVKIVFPSEQTVYCEFDWSFDRLEAFADDLIETEELYVEQKDEFKVFVKEHVRAARRARQEVVCFFFLLAKAARLKAIEEMSEETKQAFQSIKFYKFYPQPSPDISGVILIKPFLGCQPQQCYQILFELL